MPRLWPAGLAPLQRSRINRLFAVVSLTTGLALAGGTLASADVTDTLISGTAVLLSATSSSGNGGNTSSTSSMTNIFSPASYVDYKRAGGEPTVVVDRYPFTPGQFGNNTGANQFRDIVYISNPLGVGYPGFSELFKSVDLGQSFRVPPHDPIFGNPDGTIASGGGDSHQDVGEVTHNVFFVDLSGACVTMNRSTDLGETFVSDKLGCGTSFGVIDDRQWVNDDELYPDKTQRVYISFNDDTSPAPSIVLARSKQDGIVGSFGTDSLCNPLTGAISVTPPPSDTTPTVCPDPADAHLYVSGAIEVDKSPSSPYYHSIYIPFIRQDSAGNFSLWVAISRDGGDTWQRFLVATVGPHNPANIFPNMTIDTGGNLYFDWSQDQSANPSQPGEQDVYYTFSQGGGLTGTWAPPTDITQETGDSAVFPWMVAGDPGRVDVVFYKANSGANSNLGGTSVWNVYWGQSNNLLTGSRNINSVQISDHPNHVGTICTFGTGCGGSDSRSLLDFFTVDVDHQGAANVTWADDNNGRNDTRDKYSHQIAGNGVFQGQSISWHQQWPIQNHAVTDPAGDVYDGNGLPVACPSMDVLAASESRSNSLATISLTLGAPPTSVAAAGCSRSGASGGLWGAEFWAASTPDTTTGGTVPNDNFYIAYRDNPGDPNAPSPGVEAGRVNSIDGTLTAFEFHRLEAGTLGGSCLTSAGVVNPAAPVPCTITMTADLGNPLMGIKSGAGLYSISGLSVYYYLSELRPPLFRVPLGLSNQADAAAPFDQEGTGTLP